MTDQCSMSNDQHSKTLKEAVDVLSNRKFDTLYHENRNRHANNQPRQLTPKKRKYNRLGVLHNNNTKITVTFFVTAVESKGAAVPRTAPRETLFPIHNGMVTVY